MRPTDLGEREEVDALIEYITAEFGQLHILVNNAGVTKPQPLLEYADEAWDETLRVNLDAPFRLARGLAPLMPEGGSIINITSIAAELGAGDNPAYGAAKGGLKQLTKFLAHDLAAANMSLQMSGLTASATMEEDDSCTACLQEDQGEVVCDIDCTASVFVMSQLLQSQPESVQRFFLFG